MRWLPDQLLGGTYIYKTNKEINGIPKGDVSHHTLNIIGVVVDREQNIITVHRAL